VVVVDCDVGGGFVVVGAVVGAVEGVGGDDVVPGASVGDPPHAALTISSAARRLRGADRRPRT
jgi:hypothetical protein